MPAVIERPPELLNPQRRPRRVGIEIEFGGIGVGDAAAMVQELYGGTIREVSRHRLEVAATRFGDFRVEINSHYVHGTPVDGETLVDRMRAALGDIAGRWLPVEIAAPPVEIDDLAAIDRMVLGLRARHAAGTRSRRIYTFDLQLNPDVPSTEPDSLKRHLQAYVVLSSWLRASIEVDATRRLLPFVRPFPEPYVRKVLAADYRPDLHGLVCRLSGGQSDPLPGARSAAAVRLARTRAVLCRSRRSAGEAAPDVPLQAAQFARRRSVLGRRDRGVEPLGAGRAAGGGSHPSGGGLPRAP